MIAGDLAAEAFDLSCEGRRIEQDDRRVGRRQLRLPVSS
jgi:hypothetical protein